MIKPAGAPSCSRFAAVVAGRAHEVRRGGEERAPRASPARRAAQAEQGADASLSLERRLRDSGDALAAAVEVEEDDADPKSDPSRTTLAGVVALRRRKIRSKRPRMVPPKGPTRPTRTGVGARASGAGARQVHGSAAVARPAQLVADVLPVSFCASVGAGCRVCPVVVAAAACRPTSAASRSRARGRATTASSRWRRRTARTSTRAARSTWSPRATSTRSSWPSTGAAGCSGFATARSSARCCACSRWRAATSTARRSCSTAAWSAGPRGSCSCARRDSPSPTGTTGSRTRT